MVALEVGVRAHRTPHEVYQATRRWIREQQPDRSYMLGRIEALDEAVAIDGHDFELRAERDAWRDAFAKHTDDTSAR